MSTPKPPEMGMIGLLYVREKSQKSIFRLNPFFRSITAPQTEHGEMPKICRKSNFSLTNNWLIRLSSGHIVVPMGTTKPPEMDRIGQLYVREKMLRSQIFGLRGEHVYHGYYQTPRGIVHRPTGRFSKMQKTSKRARRKCDVGVI